MVIEANQEREEEKQSRTQPEQTEIEGDREAAAETKQQKLTPHQPEEPWNPSLPHNTELNNLLTTSRS